MPDIKYDTFDTYSLYKMRRSAAIQEFAPLECREKMSFCV